MRLEHSLQPLETAKRVGLLGDTHGDLAATLAALDTFRENGIAVIVQLGDWGFIFPGSNWMIEVQKLSRRMAAKGISMYFLDGNHEGFPALFRYPISDDRLRWIAPNLAHMPRGFRGTLARGKWTFAVLGGANSIDREWRTEGLNWWQYEAISAEDTSALGVDRVDVMFGHQAPNAAKDLTTILEASSFASSPDLAWALLGRATYTRAWETLKPRVALAGHYHLLHREIMVGGHTKGHFETELVVLDRVGPGRSCMAILDTTTLDVAILPPQPGTRIE